MSETEAKHCSLWLYDKDGDFYCSKCGKYPPLMRETKYCPMCGNEMKGDEK